MLGQEIPLRLISDTISYDKMSENLSATGNVKVIYEKTTLSAEKISYDKKNDKLSIICLLYTSDAADEGLGVDFCGRRIL